MGMSLPTLGHYRHVHGLRTVLASCVNGSRCWHQATLDVGGLPDDLVLKSLESRMVCTQCGVIGADVRPNWSERPLPYNSTVVR